MTRATYLSGAETFSEPAIVLKVRPHPALAKAAPKRAGLPSLSELKKRIAKRSATTLSLAEANTQRLIGRSRL